MSGISFIGSYSGIDRATIDQLMAAERIPLNQLNNQKTTITAQQNAWKDVNTRLNTLFDKLNALRNPATFNTMKPVSSNEDILTASASSSAVAGRYEINVENLATSTRIIGGDANENIQSGTFVIKNHEGLEIEIKIDEEDSLEKIVETINSTKTIPVGDETAKSIGISATVIGGKIVLTDEETGKREITLTASNNETLTQLGLGAGTSDNGEDASLTINGVPVYSKSNTITDAVLGLTLELHEEGDSVINVSNDTEKLTDTIKAFVDQYNSTMAFIEEQLAVGTVTDEGTTGRGTLAGDSSLRSLHDSLRRMVTNYVHEDNPSTIKDISALGITTTDKSGVLSFNSSKLLDEFSKDSQNVINFFNYEVGDDNFGFVQEIDRRINSYISSSDGLIKSKNESFDRTLRDLNDRIDRFNDRMVRREEYYIKTFTALDVAMMEAESQMAWLTSQIQGMNAQMGANNR